MMNSDDLFSQFFGGQDMFSLAGPLGAARGRGRQRRRGQDTRHPISVSLEDLYNGKTVKLQLNKNVICKSCVGQGGRPGAMRPCRSCQGQGVRAVCQQLAPGMITRSLQSCSDCNGEGEIINERDRCKACNGQKVTKEDKVLEVLVEKGMRDGQRITLRGEGDEEPGVEPGDVVLILQEKPHEKLKRIQHDLFFQHSVNLREALCGMSIAVPHLDGRTIIVKNPPGKVIKPNCIRGVVGEGMPIYGRPNEKGNLYIKFDVEVPTNNFTEEGKLKELERLLPRRPVFVAPQGECEEVNLHDYNPSEDDKSRGREAYNSDDDDFHGGGHGVSCATQ